MRFLSVKNGINLVVAAVVLIILSTFFHEPIADIICLSVAGEATFIFLGLFWGGIFGCTGIVVTVIGIFRTPFHRLQAVVPTLLVLAASLLLFLFLFWSSFAPSEPAAPVRGQAVII